MVMKGPFPGMDPYLEVRWSDVHVTLIAMLKEVVQPQLPAGLRARSEERVLLETVEEDQRAVYRSDIALIDTGSRGRAGQQGGAIATEPVLIELYAGPQVDRFVQIIDLTDGNRVVTAIKVLSPWNKGAGRLNKEYRKKLEDYVRAEVNTVQIDLLRSSRGRLEVGQEGLPIDRRAPYLKRVRRASRPNRWEVYPMPLRQPLPEIPIPLREKEADIVLDLQPLIERVYVAGGHDDIDYRKPPEPPLEGEDAAWSDQMLEAAGRR